MGGERLLGSSSVNDPVRYIWHTPMLYSFTIIPLTGLTAINRSSVGPLTPELPHACCLLYMIHLICQTYAKTQTLVRR